MDGNRCGQFTTEGIHSLVIKGNCKNKGSSGLLAHNFYTGTPAKQLLGGTAVTHACEDGLLSLGAPF